MQFYSQWKCWKCTIVDHWRTRQHRQQNKLHLFEFVFAEWMVVVLVRVRKSICVRSACSLNTTKNARVHANIAVFLCFFFFFSIYSNGQRNPYKFLFDMQAIMMSSGGEGTHPQPNAMSERANAWTHTTSPLHKPYVATRLCAGIGASLEHMHDCATFA